MKITFLNLTPLQWLLIAPFMIGGLVLFPSIPGICLYGISLSYFLYCQIRFYRRRRLETYWNQTYGGIKHDL